VTPLSPGASRTLAWVAPLPLYLVISVVMIGRPVIDHLDSTAMGGGADPAFFAWALKWWPEVVGHGWDPLHSSLVWAPSGFNMTWAPTMPAASLLLAPLTQTAGPLVSYNVLVLSAPALSGWAMFGLCRVAGAGYAPSLAGGYVFGFSSYMLGNAPAHPNLTLVAALPLAALLAVLLLQGRLSYRWFVLAMAATLAFEFFTSTELFLMLVVFGASAFAIAALVYRGLRPAIGRAVLLTVLAGAIAGVLASPFVLASITDPNRLTTIEPAAFSLDPINLVVPTEVTWIGGELLSPVSDRFSAGPGELGGYLGAALIAILVIFAWEQRRRRGTLMLGGFLLFALLLALGPRLVVLGDITPLRLPWLPLAHLPVTKLALPVRTLVFAWIPVALALALWLTRRSTWWSWGLTAVAAVMLLPNLGFRLHTPPYVLPAETASFWHTGRVIPGFFSNGEAERVLGGRRALIVPYGWTHRGEDMLWQADAGMSFDMPEAYLGGTIPDEFLCWTVVAHLLSGQYPPQDRRELLDFLAAKQVDAVVVGDRFAKVAEPLFSVLGAPQSRDGVQLYEVPPGHAARMPASCRGVNGA
jgi:hypothetical protein